MVTPEWLAANWWLLAIIALAVGFILGWLIIGLPARRKASAFASSAATNEGKIKDAEKNLTASRKQEQDLQSSLSKTQADLAQAIAQLNAAQEEATVREGRAGRTETSAHITTRQRPASTGGIHQRA